MDELLKKIKINKPKLRSNLAKYISHSLSNLSKPCYRLSIKKHYYEMLKQSNLTDKEIMDFNKDLWKGRKEQTNSIFKDRISMFYIILMRWALKEKDQVLYKYLVLFYTIRQYSSAFERHFPKFCNEDTFKYTMDILTKTHLFSREKTIGNALYHISNDLVRHWSYGIEEFDMDKVSRFILDARHRVSQSVRSFAQTYYRAAEEGKSLKTHGEPVEGEDKQPIAPKEKPTKSIENITKKITLYKYVDVKAQEEARNLSKINSSLATLITNNLNQVKHSDQIRTILKLFIKNLKEVDLLCGDGYFDYIKKLMSLKRSKDLVYFKQQVESLLVKVLADIKYLKKYEKLTNQTRFLINVFLAYYITLIFRNTLCS